MALLIRGGTVVNADLCRRADVLVEGERIVAVGENLEAPAGAEIVDASGAYVMPGGIDPHTHRDSCSWAPCRQTISSGAPRRRFPAEPP